MIARWYQKEAEEKTFDFLADHPGKNPLIVCPTGSGKSFILSSITKRLVDRGDKVLIISHVEQIIEQDYSALLRVLPEELVGVYSASMGRKEIKRVTVASIQSIYRKANLFGLYDYIIVDEAHTIPLEGSGMYRTLIQGVGKVTVIGLTATPFRLGVGNLIDCDDALFDNIIIDIPVEKLIREGYLSSLLTNATKNAIDVSGVGTVAGDYAKVALSKKVDTNAITLKIVEELLSYKDKREHWLLFSIDIKHAEHINKLLVDNGIKSDVIHSKQSKQKKTESIKRFKSGDLQCLVSVATLTTGFDCPSIDLIGLVRPTQSPVLHIQMIGRGLRIAQGKQNCLVLDFAGNIMRLGPINDVHIKIKGKNKNKGQPVIKECVKCNSHVPAGAKTCYFCGYIFPPPASMLEYKASNLDIIKNKSEHTENGWYPVTHISYMSYMSFKKRRSMKVVYTLGNHKQVAEYINPFENTRSSYNNMQWWNYRTTLNLPSTIAGMVSLSNKLKQPRMLEVIFQKKYSKIKTFSF